MSWSGVTPVVTDQFTHSLYYKTGVNRFITSSLYGQFNPSQFLIGDELYVSTPLGPVALNYAMKQTTDIDGYGHSAQILYTTYPLYSSPDQWAKLMNFGFLVSLRSSKFLSFGVSNPVAHDGSFLLKFSSNLSFKLENIFNGSIQLSEIKAVTGASSGRYISIGDLITASIAL